MSENHLNLSVIVETILERKVCFFSCRVSSSMKKHFSANKKIYSKELILLYKGTQLK